MTAATAAMIAAIIAAIAAAHAAFFALRAVRLCSELEVAAEANSRRSSHSLANEPSI